LWIKVVSLQNQRLCTVNRWNFEIAVVFWFFLCEKDLRPKSYRKLLVRGKIWDSTVIVQFANLPYVAKKNTKTTKKSSSAFSKQFSPISKTRRLFGKSCLFVSKCLSSSRKARMASSRSWLWLCWMLCFFASDKEFKSYRVLFLQQCPSGKRKRSIPAALRLPRQAEEQILEGSWTFAVEEGKIYFHIWSLLQYLF